MKSSIKIKSSETIIYIVLWLVVLLMPVFFSQYENGINWSRVAHEWIRLIPYLIIFLLHNYLLFPIFLIQKKYLFYLGLTLLLIIGISILTVLLGSKFGPSRGFMPQPMDLPPFPQKPVQMRELVPVRTKIWQLLIFEDFITSILVIGFNLSLIHI